MKTLDYYPSCNIDSNKSSGFEESFIWCDVIYNNINNILAIYGCYWACPYGLVLVDFADPLLPAENQVSVDLIKDLGSIDSFEWQGNKLVIYSTHSTKTFKKIVFINIKNKIVSEKKVHVIEEEEYLKWI